jgi:hypothetical protein
MCGHGAPEYWCGPTATKLPSLQGGLTNKRAKTVVPEVEICSEGDQLLELNAPFKPIQQ